MGCDIHLYIEYKIYDHWFTIVKNPFMTRNYRVFNALAGVRGDSAPLYALRGFPKDQIGTDASDDFFEDGAKCLDWHSTTWLTPDEFAKVLEHVPDSPTECHALLALCRVLEREYQVRLIMWFDN